VTDTDIKQSLVDEFLKERLKQYDRLFSSPIWKKSLYPYLKALYEIEVRRVLAEMDHTKSDVAKGRALAFENIINLPKFVEYMLSNKTNHTNQNGDEKLPGPATDYMGDFDEL
jgi:hypothetical protein